MDNFLEEYNYLLNNYIEIITDSNILNYYNTIRNIDFREIHNIKLKLIIGWISFLCGDNPTTFMLVDGVDIDDFDNRNDKSCLLALQALIKYMLNSNDGVKLSKKSIEILNGTKSVFMGNAKLTFGQLLANSGDFEESYNIFKELGFNWLSIVALTNLGINLNNLGNYEKALEVCEEGLVRGFDFKGSREEFYDVLYLPIGIAYYRMNKNNISLHYLIKGKKVIDKIGLFHMGGITELYLFRNYYKLKKLKEMKNLLEEIELRYGNFSTKRLDVLISKFRILTKAEDNINEVSSDIEKFNLLFNIEKASENSFNKEIYNMLNRIENKPKLLSEREREILKMISRGKSNEEISKELYITIGTVKWHINNIFSKLYVKNRVEAVREGERLGEIELL